MKKGEKKILKKYYLTLFNEIISNSDNIKKFKKENLTGDYAGMDDYDDFRYVYSTFLDGDNTLKYMIKKSWLRLNLVVKVDNKKDYLLNMHLKLYSDPFQLKKNKRLKNILLNIIKSNDEPTLISYINPNYMRGIKINKLIKSK